jgi:hypothetical protein
MKAQKSTPLDNPYASPDERPPVKSPPHSQEDDWRHTNALLYGLSLLLISPVVFFVARIQGSRGTRPLSVTTFRMIVGFAAIVGFAFGVVLVARYVVYVARRDR